MHLVLTVLGRYTYGAKMYGSNEEFYFIATNAGVRMQSDGESFVVTSTRIVASTDRYLFGQTIEKQYLVRLRQVHPIFYAFAAEASIGLILVEVVGSILALSRKK